MKRISDMEKIHDGLETSGTARSETEQEEFGRQNRGDRDMHRRNEDQNRDRQNRQAREEWPQEKLGIKFALEEHADL